MAYVLPRKKQEILAYLEDYIEKEGFAPTLTEIAKQLKVHSLATIHEHLTYLEERKFIARDARQERGIRILRTTRKTKESREIGNDAISLPLVGLITAGEPIEAIENIDRHIPVAKEMVRGKNAYVLKVQGDSMIESLIQDGDYVVVEKTEYAQNGDTVVALLEDGTATLKKFFKDKHYIRLQPANKKYKPRLVKNLVIQGKVLGIIRSFA
ncbi:MAG: transcriptional repressor LexA [Patescibacteria group bacterium]|jgi:repressor LexA